MYIHNVDVLRICHVAYRMIEPMYKGRALFLKILGQNVSLVPGYMKNVGNSNFNQTIKWLLTQARDNVSYSFLS